jgi:hypothetical protein
MTPRHTNVETKYDPEIVALSALAWTLSDPARAERLIALTGLDPADLRERVGDADVLDAVLGFLEGHEPDLIACAAALSVKPEALIAARARIGT